jgi:hypothetical protein
MFETLDSTLRFYGVAPERINPKKSFARDDKPPKETLVLTSRYFGPKKFNTSDEFNFDTTNPNASFAMTQREVLEWANNRIKKLKELYKNQEHLVPHMANANKTAIYNSKASDRRKHFYYCYLLALMNAPVDIAFSNIEKLNCLRKLWRNRAFKQDAEGLAVPDMCCCFETCPFIAVHGSKYCGWHILNDENQKLFRKCSQCGMPCVILDAVACPGHRPYTYKPKGDSASQSSQETSRKKQKSASQESAEPFIDPENVREILSKPVPEPLKDTRVAALNLLMKYTKGTPLTPEEKTVLLNTLELIKNFV